MAEEEPLFRPFTKESLATNKEHKNSEEKPDDENARNNEKNKALHPDDNLEEGQPLPVWIGESFPKHMTSAPLEDIDPFYQNKKTFVVINKNKNIFRFSATDALWILSPFSPIRKGAINILIHPLFSVFIIITILVNCVFMTLPEIPIVDIAEYIFVGIYTIEAAVKIIARGLILQPFTYFRNAWNWLDFVILVLAYMTIGLDLGSLSALRAFRVLRALKTVAIVPGMRLVVEALLESVKNLQNIIIVTIFLLSAFALMGLHTYMGVLTQKCIKIFPEDGSWGNLTNENWERFCQNETNWFIDGGEYQLCGNSSGASQCEFGYVCLQGYGPNPNYGYTSFDTFGWALLSTFRLWTLDFWENLYQLVLKSAGMWDVLFFLAIIFTCSYYLMTLFLTVIAISYAKIHKKIMQEKQTAEEEVKKIKNTNCRNETNNVLKSSSIPYIETDQISVEEKGNNIVPETTSNNKLSNCLTKGIDLFCVWGCCGCWVKFQKYVGLLIFDPFTELFVIVCIILNTFFMALDHHDMDREMERVLKNGNYFFTAVYILEAALKIIALSPKHYFKISWNIFDFIIVALSLLDLALEGVQGLSVLRALRLLRVFRLAKAWPTLNAVIIGMGKTMGPLGNLTFVLCIIIFIFTITGMQLFGKNYLEHVDRFPDIELPRWNFTDFLHSFMMVFRILCGEWIESMWDCMLVSDATCVPFFVAAASIGKLVITSFFILLLLSDFGSAEILKQTDQDKNEITESSNRISRFIKWIRRKKSNGIEGEILKDKIDCKDTRVAAGNVSFEMSTDCPNPTLDRNDEPHQELSKLRLKIIKLTESKFVEIIVISVILLSSVALAFEDIYLIHRPILEEIVLNLDRVFTIIFMLEMLVKWYALGFKKYFTNAWCCLDFLIVMLSLVVHGTVIAADDDDLAFRSMLALRALRPLRIIPHWGRLRVVAHTLVKTVPSVFGVLLVCLLFWLIFAIMGVQLFAGKFFKCVDSDYTILDYQVVPDRYTCITENYTWVNSPMNFDHVGNAYLSLFQVATFKGWIQIMNDAVDSREVNLQPIRETNIYMYLYFIVFINNGSFYTLYLVVSAIINHFKVQKKNVGGYLEMFMTTNQTNNYRTNKNLGSLPLKSPPRPKWQPQAAVFDMVTHKKFDLIIMLIIILNMVTMAFDHYQQSESFSMVLDYLNLIFTLIYSIECVWKIFGLRHHYFLDPWNLFDFAIVILSILDLTLSDIIAKYFISPIILRILRVIRLARLSPIIRLVKGTKSARSLQYTLTTSIPAVLNICLLFFVVTFVYAIFGMSFFMHVKDKSALNDVTNFKTFGHSMILLFQMSTFAGWDGVLDGIINVEDCDLPNKWSGYPGNCGSPTIGIIYLVSYLIISFFVFTHMFIVVILENYSQATDEALSEEYCDMYHTVWNRFDPNNTQYISYDQLSDFFEALEPPLQLPKPNTHIIESMNITISENDTVSCADLWYLLKTNISSTESQNEDLEVGRPN